MYFNYGYKRQQFELEQTELRKQYKAAGMTEEAIQAMYEDSLAWFRSCRNETLHGVYPQEMMTVDPSNGDFRYMDMDELPASAQLITSTDRFAWIEEIKDPALYGTVRAMKQDYIEIITLMMEGYQQNDIAGVMRISRPALNEKVMRIREKLKKFSPTPNF